MSVRLCLCVLIGLWLASVPIAFAQAPVYFQPQDTYISGSGCEQMLCIEVHIGECEGIKGYHMAITFNTDYLTLEGIYESDFFDTSAFFWMTEDSASIETIVVDCGNLGSPVPGPGHLFTICFEPPYFCTPAGEPMPLAFEYVDVRSSGEPNSIPTETIDGTITIRCGATALERRTWSSIKEWYR